MKRGSGSRHRYVQTTIKLRPRCLHCSDFCGIESGKLFCRKTHIRFHIGSKDSSSATNIHDDKSQQGHLHHCDRCDYKTRKPSDLKAHIRAHTGEHPFKCPLCSYSFSRRCHLIIHLRVHTGEKPFQCPSCSRSFSQRPTLNRHLRVHTGERPYRCTVCSKSFARSNDMKRHMKKLHHGKPENIPGHAYSTNHPLQSKFVLFTGSPPCEQETRCKIGHRKASSCTEVKASGTFYTRSFHCSVLSQHIVYINI
ncbi:uncharacterized protein [Dermacentor andersoni]|uniref:uncharacterized protein n=1 Tax=Dermacentor andersoni TaxID=34620 RepID=UPI003B3A6E54